MPEYDAAQRGAITDRSSGGSNESLRRPVMEKKQQIHFWYVIAAVLLMLFIQSLYLQSTKLTPIPYSRFETLLDAKKVNEVAITQNRIQGSLKEAEPDGLKDFVTTRVQPPELAESLTKHGVTYSGIVESHWIADVL